MNPTATIEGIRDMRIGVPRGLMYSRYGTTWQTLVTALGHEAVVSPQTNRAILDQGCRLAVDETCLSVKAYLGQVSWLAERTDAVLVPRFVSVWRGECECVKLWGIHDIARNSLPEANIIGYSVDARGETHRANGPARGLYEFAVSIGASPAQALLATTRAILAEKAVRAREAVAARTPRQNGDGPRILVVGHDYNLKDEMIGAPVIRTLRELGCRVEESGEVPEQTSRRLANEVSPGLAWTNSKHLLGAVHKMLDVVDGIIIIVTFPCGPDSMVSELITRTVCGIPIITLVLDEHSGEGGMKTRLESFVDIVSMQSSRTRPHGTRIQNGKT